jgi:hypothetical protein
MGYCILGQPPDNQPGIHISGASMIAAVEAYIAAFPNDKPLVRATWIPGEGIKVTGASGSIIYPL